VPVFHQALARGLDRPHPIAVLNAGGVVNVTFVDGGDPIARDTGPGNALIDDFVRARTGAPLDSDGDQAAKGSVHEDFVAQVLADPFLDCPYPKSLDRMRLLSLTLDLPDFTVADGAATLSALTAASVARIVPHLPEPPRPWIVAGGGASNPTLMRMLAGRLKPRCRRLVLTIDRSADLCLSSGAHAQRSSNYIPQDDWRTQAIGGRGSGAALRRAIAVASFGSQECRTKSRIELPVIVRDFLAFADCATRNDMAIVPMGVGIVRVVHVVVVIDSQQDFAVHPIAVIPDVVPRGFG